MSLLRVLRPTVFLFILFIRIQGDKMSEVGVNGMHSMGEGKFITTGQSRAEGYREGYLKALEDARTVVDEEFDRWLDDKDEEYPDFGNIHTGLEHLKSAYEKEQGDGN